MHDIYELIEVEDLTPDLLLVSKFCGLDAVRSLLRHCQGMNFYIPKLSRMEKFISGCFRRFPDKTFKELAIELHLSENYIRKFYRKRLI